VVLRLGPVRDVTGYSQLADLAATGTVNVAGAHLNLAVGYTPHVGDALTILQTLGATVAGTFAGLPNGAVFTAGAAY
jgi:hypothetical protein